MNLAMASTKPESRVSIPCPKVAVVGCGHGELDAIYATLEVKCSEKGWAMSDLDFVIINGDFQAMRNSLDLNCMSVPHRYRKMGDFHKYYSGELRAPVLTLVIGGNHEASNYLYELYYGGWLAPNIYYLGAAGVIRYGPWRIAGLSGIYSPADYHKPHHERLPYDRDDIRSIYHVRECDVQKLLRIRTQVHIGLSHDWPAWVELFGNYQSLYNKKPHFFDSAKRDGLGSKPATEVMNHLRPSYWFSGHMHVKFSATVKYTSSKIEESIRALLVPDMWRSKLPIFKNHRGLSKSSASQPAGSLGTTKFLALDKLKPGHPAPGFLELMELDLPEPSDAGEYLGREDGKFGLFYDEEWLAITRAYADTLRLQEPETLDIAPATAGKPSEACLAKHMSWVKQNIVERGLLRVPRNFIRHAPIYDAKNIDAGSGSPPEYPNQQTAEFLERLQIPNKFSLDGDSGGCRRY